MANPSDISWGLDVYRIVAFPLDTDGSLLAVDTSPYSGVEFAGPKSFIPSFGALRAIPNISQGRVNDTIHLPSIEPKTAEMHTSYDKQTLNALLMNVNKATVGEATTVHYGTDKQGEEPLVGMLVSQLVSHDDDGLVVWRHWIVPRGTIVPSPEGYDENALDKLYEITLSGAKRELWGEELTEGVHGCTSSTMTQTVSENNYQITAWLGDNVDVNFYTEQDKDPVSAAKTKLWKFSNGASLGFVLGSDTYGPFITPTVKPSNDELIIATYEWE